MGRFIFTCHNKIARYITNKLVDLPENLRAAHEEPEDFALDSNDKALEASNEAGIVFANEPDEWQKIDEKEKRDKEEAGKNICFVSL